MRLEVKHCIADPRREPTNNIKHHQTTKSGRKQTTETAMLREEEAMVA
jgi:hypothetical protein